jgi:hypothetical protein
LSNHILLSTIIEIFPEPGEMIVLRMVEPMYPNTASNIYALLTHGMGCELASLDDDQTEEQQRAGRAAWYLARQLAAPAGQVGTIDDALRTFITVLRILHRNTVSYPPMVDFRILRGGGSTDPGVSRAILQVVADMILHGLENGCQEIQVASVCAPPVKVISIRSQGNPWHDMDLEPIRVWLDPLGIGMREVGAEHMFVAGRRVTTGAEIMVTIPLREILLIEPVIQEASPNT